MDLSFPHRVFSELKPYAVLSPARTRFVQVPVLSPAPSMIFSGTGTPQVDFSRFDRNRLGTGTAPCGVPVPPQVDFGRFGRNRLGTGTPPSGFHF